LIGSNANTLEQETSGTQGKPFSRLASDIKLGVSQMNLLLADLSAYSVEGMSEEAYEKFDVGTVVAHVIQDMPANLQVKGVKIRVQNLPDIHANKRQITLVFRHLIENALKFRAATDPEIHIHCEVKSKYYRFSVRDNGIGIPVKDQHAIFAAFKRLIQEDSPFQGTGMGLAICRKIIEMHQGKIWVHSQPGEGSTFFFTLPRS
jgi:light-regulated signal transduction histidine kinase (bacteriophytochrome)